MHLNLHHPIASICNNTIITRFPKLNVKNLDIDIMNCTELYLCWFSGLCFMCVIFMNCHNAENNQINK